MNLRVDLKFPETTPLKAQMEKPILTLMVHNPPHLRYILLYRDMC